MAEISTLRSGNRIFDFVPPVVVPDGAVIDTIGQFLGVVVSEKIAGADPDAIRNVGYLVTKVIDEDMESNPTRAIQLVQHELGSNHTVRVSQTSLYGSRS